MRSDHDVLHDHPWWFNISILWSGAYSEITPKGVRVLRGPALRLRVGPAPHSVQLTHGVVWTLFITGPKYRIWGFHCPNGWVPFDVFKRYSSGIKGEVVGDVECP
jgi:hypothetical protein